MDTSKIIKGVVNSGRYTVTAPIVKEDYGLYLKIEGVELPSTYEVDFSNSEHNGTSVTMIGNADGVLIPRQFIDSGKDVFAFLYHVGSDFGRTVYKFRIPNKVRPDRTNEEPTPEEQSVIDQAISALNEAVAQTAQDVIDADASAQSASESAEQAESAKGVAQNYAQDAQTSATYASQSESNAQASATASANSASQSAQIKADVEDLVDNARGYASASANSASQAQGYAQSASASAQSASGYASQAQSSAQTASTKAQDASTSAQTASAKASESAQSATNAQGYAQTAEQAKTDAQTAQGLAESARDTAVSAKTDAESARDNAVQAKEDAESAVASISGALADKAPAITDTASGSIASFSDGADDLPLKSLVVDINPVQDLHGQDAPYPAGGGKNKFQTTAISNTVNGTTFTVNADGSIRISGTPTVNINSNYVFGEVTLQAGSYKLNGNAYQNDAVRLTCYNVTTSSYISSFYNNQDVSFTLTETSTLRLFPFVGTAYDGNALTFYPMIRLASVTDATFAPYSNICPISGWTEVNVNHSDADMTNPTTLTIQLGQTVYGGKLDVLTGELVITHEAYTFNGTEAISMSAIGGHNRFNASVFASNTGSQRAKGICSHLTYAYQPVETNTIDLRICCYNGRKNLYWRWDTMENVDSMKAYLAQQYANGTPMTVVAILESPIEIQLSANQLNSLYGVNNIWADSGDTEVEYRADTKAWIQRKIAEALASLT